MKTNRIKLTHPAVRTRADLEVVVREIAELTLARNTEQTELDRDITAAREAHELQLSALTKTLEEKTELARAWSDANPSEFNRLKSLDLVHGIIGWRTGQPTLKTLSGWTWDRVLEKLKTLGWLPYVRTKEEVNKQQIIADRETIAPEDMRAIGVRVIQDESFFVEPKLAELENRQTIEAS
jgi:phage host-nuclease inhibitor protein Gam